MVTLLTELYQGCCQDLWKKAGDEGLGGQAIRHCHFTSSRPVLAMNDGNHAVFIENIYWKISAINSQFKTTQYPQITTSYYEQYRYEDLRWRSRTWHQGLVTDRLAQRSWDRDRNLGANVLRLRLRPCHQCQRGLETETLAQRSWDWDLGNEVLRPSSWLHELKYTRLSRPWYWDNNIELYCVRQQAVSDKNGNH